MQMNFQGVEHNLRQIEQIDSGLYNNEDTQRVIQELGSKYTNEQQLRKLCFFHWEALAQDAVEQNDIFVSHWKIPGKVEFDAIKTFGDASRTFPILVGNEIQSSTKDF